MCIEYRPHSPSGSATERELRPGGLFWSRGPCVTFRPFQCPPLLYRRGTRQARDATTSKTEDDNYSIRGGGAQHIPVGRKSAMQRVYKVFLWGERSRVAAQNVFLCVGGTAFDSCTA